MQHRPPVTCPSQHPPQPPHPDAHHARHHPKKHPCHPQPERARKRRQRPPHRSPRHLHLRHIRNPPRPRRLNRPHRSSCARPPARLLRRSRLCHSLQRLRRVPRPIPQRPSQTNLVHPSSLAAPHLPLSCRGRPNALLVHPIPKCPSSYKDRPTHKTCRMQRTVAP